MEQEVVDYVLQAQKHGLSDFEIKQNLLNVGWDAAIVEQNFVLAKAAETRPALADKTFRPPADPLLVRQQVVPASPPEAAPVVHTAQDNANETDEQVEKISQPDRTNPKKNLAWALGVVVLLILAGGGYAYYTYAAATPAKVWTKFTSVKKSPTFKTAFSISYADSAAPATASSTQPIKLSFSENADIDNSDTANRKINNNVTVGVSSGTLQFNIGFQYMLLGKILYVNAGQISQLKTITNDPNLAWVKIDFDELTQYLKQQGVTSTQGTQDLYGNSDLQNQLKAIWEKAPIVIPTNFLAKETVNGIPTYHLKSTIDNQAINTAMQASLDVLSKANPDQKVTDQAKQFLTALISKVSVKEFDMWIGQSDSQLYKMHLALNAPSVKDLSSPQLLEMVGPLSANRAQARDAKRIADARQAASAFELYFNDNNGYPDGIGGQPQGITPTYLPTTLTAPEPADGVCNEYYNGYWYEPDGKPVVVKGVKVYPSYKMTFCLGNPVGGFAAGIAQLTPKGITAAIPCPSTPDKCVPSTQNSDADPVAVVSQMNFTGEIVFDSTYSDYGKPVQITAPENPQDILDLVKNLMGSGSPPMAVPSSTPSLMTN